MPTTLLAFGFVLGVLVFVHELGHFLVARWHGVRVLTFSLGFGPKLLSIKRGDTEYCLSAIPLGGYVKMAGENPDDNPQGASDEFLSTSKWQRFQVLLAGPAMNMILAVVLLAVVLMQGDRVFAFLSKPAVIGVVQAGSPAEPGGMQAGDEVVRINGRTISTWEELDMAVTSKPEFDVEFVVKRQGQERTLQVRPATTKLKMQSDTTFEVGTIGVLPDTYPLIDAVNAGDPAAKAGFQKGDVILSIEGKRMVYSANVSDALKTRGGQPTTIVVRRSGAELPITVTPEQRGANAVIGITLGAETISYTPGPIEAIGLSVKRNVQTAGLILQTLGDLFTGGASPKQLMGPVGIATLSGESARRGWVELFALMASISLNLGLLNLLPIPVLDGGHMAIMGMEAVARRDFSLAVKEKMLFAGFVLLMLLMVTVIYNDLTRVAWIERLMPWRN
ncbi:MAG: RIP metalloprotease RseP [Acidobacteria bacterium]|nr:RIP metalloprotease RseP [Acidobacteriota bacterium]